MDGMILGGMANGLDVEGLSKTGVVTSLGRHSGSHKMATYLRAHGLDVEVIDFLPAWTLDELKDLTKLRYNSKMKFIGIGGTFDTNFDTVRQYIAWVNDTYPNVLTVTGSQLFFHIHQIPADYHVIGYGEKAMLAILDGTVKYTDTVYNENGDTRRVVDAMHSYPAFPMSDLSIEYEIRDFLQPDEMVTMECSRGCKFKCKFCSFNVIGYKGDASRCMTNLYDEMKRNYENWGVTDYSCADETTNADPDVLFRTAEAIRKLPFEVNMQGYVRGDLIAARPQDWEHIADMGLWGHYYGIESFNHASAKSIGKGMHPDKLKKGLVDAQDYFLKRLNKFRTTFSFIIGLPHETEETFEDGVDWMFKNMKTPSLNMFPLTIQHSITDSKLKNSYSEFDLTWDKTGLFTETSLEELGATKEIVNNDMIWERLNRTDVTKWSHETMNILGAYKLFSKYQNDESFWSKQYPNIWFFHRYMNAGLDYEDLHKSLSQLGGVKIGISAAVEKVNQYKEKKLNQ